jgi:hypothetical protein
LAAGANRRARGGYELTRQLWAALALAGLAVQLALPGLDLAVWAEVPWTLLGPLPPVCHSPGPDRPAAVPAGGEDDEHPGSHGCCLFCHTAQGAKGFLPGQTLALSPPRDLGSVPLPTLIAAAPRGHASLYKLPRAPPVA